MGRPALPHQMEVGQPVQLDFRGAEGNRLADVHHFEHARLRCIADLHIQSQLGAQIVRLLQGVLAHFRRPVGRAGRRRHPEILRPDPGPGDHIEVFDGARYFRPPSLHPHRGRHMITAGLGHSEIRRQIDPFGRHLRRVQFKFAHHRHLGVFQHNQAVCPLHVKGQPVRFRTQMQRLPGTVRDPDGHRHGFAWQKLLLLEHHFHRDLRRGAETHRDCQPEGQKK